jgi:hypothetical protein
MAVEMPAVSLTRRLVALLAGSHVQAVAGQAAPYHGGSKGTAMLRCALATRALVCGGSRPDSAEDSH